MTKAGIPALADTAIPVADFRYRGTAGIPAVAPGGRQKWKVPLITIRMPSRFFAPSIQEIRVETK